MQCLLDLYLATRKSTALCILPAQLFSFCNLLISRLVRNHYFEQSEFPYFLSGMLNHIWINSKGFLSEWTSFVHSRLLEQLRHARSQLDDAIRAHVVVAVELGKSLDHGGEVCAGPERIAQCFRAVVDPPPAAAWVEDERLARSSICCQARQFLLVGLT